MSPFIKESNDNWISSWEAQKVWPCGCHLAFLCSGSKKESGIVLNYSKLSGTRTDANAWSLAWSIGTSNFSTTSLHWSASGIAPSSPILPNNPWGTPNSSQERSTRRGLRSVTLKLTGLTWDWWSWIGITCSRRAWMSFPHLGECELGQYRDGVRRRVDTWNF